MALYAALFKWMQASVSCMLAGLLVWLLLAVALRRWPALMPRRALWLAAQAVTAGAALLAFLPPLAPTGIAPAVTLSAAETSLLLNATRPALTPAAPASAEPSQPEPDAGSDSALSSPALLLPALWALVYGAGLALALARLLRAHHLWRGLLATGQPLSPSELHAHGAFSDSQLAAIAQRGLVVIETDAAISPMLIGMRRPLLLLPQHLRDFSAEQQQMIIAHELHHWRARDPLCLGVSAILRTVFWFNPALRWMNARLEWALELTCDQRVLAGRPQQQRKQYAAALLLQWKAQTAMLPAGGVAFGGIHGATAAARIRQMQQAGLPALSRAATFATSVAMACVLAGGAMLQPALGFNVGTPAPPAAANSATPPAQEAWRYPLDNMRVTGFFGVHRDVLPTPHKGIDLAAPAGTPVHAAAAGVVISAGALAEHEGRYGNAVIIEHGARRSLYAHLSSVAVQSGQRVEAGALIGTVGETGFATGPHLHFEVREQDRVIDPAIMLAGLDAHATKHALKVRRAQQGY